MAPSAAQRYNPCCPVFKIDAASPRARDSLAARRSPRALLPPTVLFALRRAARVWQPGSKVSPPRCNRPPGRHAPRMRKRYWHRRGALVPLVARFLQHRRPESESPDPYRERPPFAASRSSI